VVAVVAILGVMYLLNKFYYSRYIVFGTILLTTAIEIFIFLGVYFAFSFHKENAAFASTRLVTQSKEMEDLESPKFFINPSTAVPVINHDAYVPPFSQSIEENALLYPLLEKYLSSHTSLYDFINQYIDLTRFNLNGSLVIDSYNIYNISSYDQESKQFFVNLNRINDFRRINQYLIKANDILMSGGVFVCCGETIAQRRNRFCSAYTSYIGMLLYLIDFMLQRVLPKLPVLQGWYFALTKGKNRPLPETEILGRLYYCGFELIHKKEIDDIMYFILKKVKAPSDNPNPTYGPLIRLKRRGLNGKIIYVKKMRTMHPYSEYLQEYVYNTCNLQEGGKFSNDFRVTSWGKIFRKLWIDELPQFINFFKGELALVGVRALSEHYFSLYPPDVQELRIKVKPGLIPPFYADMPKSFEEIVESERRYVLRKLEKPFITDWKYFWKAFWNILVKRERSN
jgi:lipopolysaccharide/colanic/teichoic acid biosynthesis glycosyltransferase